MGIIAETKVFIKIILFRIYLLVGFAFFFFIFGLKKTTLFGKSIFLPWPATDSFSVLLFKKIQHDLLPDGVQLIVTNPLSSFLAQMMISLFMAFIFTLPFFLYGFLKYLLPALLEKERKIIIRILFPSMILFFAGCLGAYFFLIPFTFNALYPFTTAIGAVPFFSVSEFISLVFGFMIAVGTMFLLPVIMIFLSFLGVVGADFWKKHWRYAFLFFIIFSAIITPDGTGITMIMLFTPMAGLYLAGTVLAKK